MLPLIILHIVRESNLFHWSICVIGEFINSDFDARYAALHWQKMSNSRIRLGVLVIFVIVWIMFMIGTINISDDIKLYQRFFSNVTDNGTMKDYRKLFHPYPDGLDTDVQYLSSFTWKRSYRTLETTIQCIGSSYNQSCLYTNLYYVDGVFTILTVKGRSLLPYSVRTNAFYLWSTKPNKREFNSTEELNHFVRRIADPMIIPSVTLHFSQSWHFNIGHALFDGLYPAYVALIRFAPRHLHPFRILAGIDHCQDCWSEDIYGRFGGLGILKERVLNKMSKGRWFLFDELIMGSGTFCQRCTQSNLQLPGGVSLDASRLFRDRMYEQHGLIPSIRRSNHSAEGRTPQALLYAYVIDNKRFTAEDRKEIQIAIEELNNYTNLHVNKSVDNRTSITWPLVHVTYLYYPQVKVQNRSSIQINATAMDSRSPVYEMTENHFIAQLKILRQMDIHVSGPGTGQMYQTFLSDGSIHLNLGGLRPWGLENTNQSYASFLEQHMTSGVPYIKGIYYPINERPKGIKRDQVVQLIRQAGQLILQGFAIPVNPLENLAADGQLFVEMCEKDPTFCSSVTERLPERIFDCLELWVEDFVHEQRQWKEGGVMIDGKNVRCPYNYTLLHQLRDKYHIRH